MNATALPGTAGVGSSGAPTRTKCASPALAAALARQVATWAGLLFSRGGCSCPFQPPPPAAFWWAGQPIADRVQMLCGAKVCLRGTPTPASFVTCCNDPLDCSSPPRRSTSTPAQLLVLLVLRLLLATGAAAAAAAASDGGHHHRHGSTRRFVNHNCDRAFL